MTLNCAITDKSFSLSEREEKLIADFGFPHPTLAPMERWLQAVGQSTPFAFRQTVCPVTKTPILSRWSESGAIVGVNSDWFWSDDCDNIIEGQDYDFNRPFFEQFQELARKCYAPSINRINCENSPYVNASYQLKDCHLCFACESLRDCYYSALCSNSNDLIFCAGVSNSELCYRCLDCSDIYEGRFLQDCINCRDCYWCLDCIGCSNCFQCYGLRQASDGYYIQNQKVTKEEWQKVIDKVNSGSFSIETQLQNDAERFFKDKRNYNTNFNNENCSAIYHVTHSKNCQGALYSNDSQDCKDIIFTADARDCYSVIWGRRVERCYQVVAANEAYDCAFCDGCIGGGRNQIYCFCCYNGCHDLFGCFFLKGRNYCILNKQYTQKEYESLLPRVKQHMQSTGEYGQWFPSSFYSVPYNDSWARYFLANLTDEQIEKRGLLISEVPKFKDSYGIELPDGLDQFSDQECNKEITCIQSGQRFSVGLNELKALRKLRCPIPRQRWSVILSQMQAKSIERCHQELAISFTQTIDETIQPDV
jgi:hypothetical protein